MKECPKTERILARDVLPDHWGLWCRFTDDRNYPEPIVNTIEHVSWSEDGEFLWFMLGTHNFYKARPDDELELIPLTPGKWCDVERLKREHAEMLAKRPVPEVQCPTCSGHGQVPMTPPLAGTDTKGE